MEFDSFAIAIETADAVQLISGRTVANTPGATPDIVDIVRSEAATPDQDASHIVQLSGPVRLGEWTMIELDVEYVDYETDDYVRTTLAMWVAHLPGDVNQDGTVGAADATAFGREYRGRRALELLDSDRNGSLDVRDATLFGDQYHGRNGFTSTRGWTLPAPPTDCNRNGRDDAAEMLAGTMLDLNANHVPDDCEPSTARRRPR